MKVAFHGRIASKFVPIFTKQYPVSPNLILFFWSFFLTFFTFLFKEQFISFIIFTKVSILR